VSTRKTTTKKSKASRVHPKKLAVTACHWSERDCGGEAEFKSARLVSHLKDALPGKCTPQARMSRVAPASRRLSRRRPAASVWGKKPGCVAFQGSASTAGGTPAGQPARRRRYQASEPNSILPLWLTKPIEWRGGFHLLKLRLARFIKLLF